MYVDQWGEIHPSPPEQRDPSIPALVPPPEQRDPLVRQGPPPPEKGKPPNPRMLGGAEETGVLDGANLKEKLQRYGKAKYRNRQMAAHLLVKASERVRHPYKRLAQKMYDCASWIAFHHYLETGNITVGRITTCKAHLLCPVCAIRRGGKMLRRFGEMAQHLAPAHSFELVTLTVKNGPDLFERYLHLKHSFKRLREHAKKGYGPWVGVDGAVWSYEFTYSQEHGWHPHLHILVAKPLGAAPFRYGQGSDLAETWHKLTGDSYIVHAAQIPPGDGLLAGISEVLKYSLKFSDLTLDQNLEAYHALKGKRLVQAGGSFYGVVPPDDDDLTDAAEDGPYIEYLYRYTSRGYTPSST